MYPLPLIWVESWSHTIKGMTEENPPKNRTRWLVKNEKHFSVNSQGKFLSWHKETRRAGKQARSTWLLASSLRVNIVFFPQGSYFSDMCYTFHLGQMFIRFLSITFDFWSLVLQFSWTTVIFSAGMFLSPFASD